MLIGTLKVELYLPGTSSLKEKRFILKSIKTRIRNNYNVSIAELDFQEKWQRSCLGIACVSNNRRFLDTTLAKVLSAITRENRLEIIGQTTEIL
jgi:uncharacterized protein YlxP (DUF503 family)